MKTHYKIEYVRTDVGSWYELQIGRYLLECHNYHEADLQARLILRRWRRRRKHIYGGKYRAVLFRCANCYHMTRCYFDGEAYVCTDFRRCVKRCDKLYKTLSRRYAVDTADVF